MAINDALCSAVSANPAERHDFRGGCLFDGGDRVDEDGRIELAVDAKRGTQVKLRHYGQIDAGNVEDGSDVVDGLSRLDQQAAGHLRPTSPR